MAGYQAPGLSVPELELLIADAMRYNVATVVELTKIDQAITMAGEAACTMDGTDWWFLWDSGTFPTVDGTASYNLRTVNTNDMTNMFAPRMVWWSTTPMGLISYQEYLGLVRTQSSVGTGDSTLYAIGGDLVAYFYTTPGSVETVTIDYLKRHGKITKAGSATADLIIPAEFQNGIYVAGAVWLLRHQTADIAALQNCPEFMAAIYRMRAAAPTEYDTTSRTGVPIPDGEHVIIITDP